MFVTLKYQLINIQSANISYVILFSGKKFVKMDSKSKVDGPLNCFTLYKSGFTDLHSRKTYLPIEDVFAISTTVNIIPAIIIAVSRKSARGEEREADRQLCVENLQSRGGIGRPQSSSSYENATHSGTGITVRSACGAVSDRNVIVAILRLSPSRGGDSAASSISPETDARAREYARIK